MATISYDRHSFLIDGLRVWLTSGAMDYARVPRRLWRSRLRAARQAGLNCILTSVFWDVHEPQPGVFRFDGELDLAAFVRTLGEEGLWCILRPGPFVDGGWDMGGLPAWLPHVEPTGRRAPETLHYRQGSPPFLQAVARYIDAVMGQVADQQVTRPSGGPIVLIQSEHAWFSHSEGQSEAYLQQVNRFLHESGCNVPLINTNNLFQQVPGTIDGWEGDDHLFANARQLRIVQPDAPRLITSLSTGAPDVWGAEREDPYDADDLLRRMVETAAAGAQFNLDPFCGGTNFGFYGGRYLDGDDRYATTSRDHHAPLSEAGGRTEKYAAVKRFATFLSHFSSLMGSLDAGEHHTVAATGVSVIQQTGSQGNAVFLIRDAETESREVELTTPDGQSLPVDFGDDPVAWLTLETNLRGVATLDVTNLRPWAMIGRNLLVLFGPAGSAGLLSIDGTLTTPDVPTGNQPLVLTEDELYVVILNEHQVDAAYIAETGLYVGIAGLDEEDRPIPHEGFGSYYHVSLEGQVKRHRSGSRAEPGRPRLGKWSYASVEPYVKGTAPRYATLEGPRALEACGADFGYGWYRVRLKRSRQKKVNLLMPRGGDRLHLYLDGKFRSILGTGPGANEGPVEFTLPSGELELVMLADNRGRFCEDLPIDWPKGVADHLLHVKSMKLNKPEVTHEPRIDPFELTGYVPRCSADDRSPYARYTFNVQLNAKKPLLLTLRGQRPRSVVLVNGQPVGIDVGREVTATFALEDGLKKGKNRIQLALIDHAADFDEEFDPREVAELYEISEKVTDGADWWYARWQMPDLEQYGEVPSQPPRQPAFFRTTFNVADTSVPLMLELAGVTKGQMYLNGHNLGRYFIATHTGKKVPPQKRYYLPEPWLSTEEPNELILFDEHGRPPQRCRLVYDEFGPFGG